ncbi:hypothetical protein GQ44DRAFT_758218 [Phaeosphaeriaceae sp. PMI808]|nr:hypothetical protein GQ44DRAFT_758218 [Phaeosphaeriaceae sp. PMI808]
MPGQIMDIQKRLGEVVLVDDSNHAFPTSASWLEDQAKVSIVEKLKTMALGNCRLLYGSERQKFYDVVVSVNEENKIFVAALVCNKDPASKFLRTSINDCPVKAVRDMVDCLQKDTMRLFEKYSVGSMIVGQQGHTNATTGRWELADYKLDGRTDGPADDTEAFMGKFSRRGADCYAPVHAPRGPRAGNKRVRTQDDRMAAQTDEVVDLEYGEPML